MADTKHKIVMVGDFSTGKTCMLIRLSQNFFDTQHNPTIGASFLKEVIELENGSKVEMNLWDTSGDERFRSVMPVYFRGADCAIIVYDVTRRETFESLDYWIDLTRKSGGDDIAIVLVGAKCDLKKEVSDEEAQNYSKRVGYPLILCSSYSGENITKVFQTAASSIKKSAVTVSNNSGVSINDPSPNKNAGGCC
ncbi:Rab family GTPase [Entamoeba histolytica HM-1:IMSS-B]|uniref:Rab family GTPase n=6 Tax=Entamoeba histolytica TaxID=5759 RepID=A0A8U0WPB0_ENTH1|eukprot:XP_648905.1 Rab family GTPase [Entamoeba histolytica HM-1:IMSS]